MNEDRQGGIIKRRTAGGFYAVITALIFAAAAVACVILAVSGLVRYKSDIGDGLTATGSASRDFESDLVVIMSENIRTVMI